ERDAHVRHEPCPLVAAIQARTDFGDVRRVLRVVSAAEIALGTFVHGLAKQLNLDSGGLLGDLHVTTSSLRGCWCCGCAGAPAWCFAGWRSGASARPCGARPGARCSGTRRTRSSARPSETWTRPGQRVGRSSIARCSQLLRREPIATVAID